MSFGWKTSIFGVHDAKVHQATLESHSKLREGNFPVSTVVETKGTLLPAGHAVVDLTEMRRNGSRYDLSSMPSCPLGLDILAQKQT